MRAIVKYLQKQILVLVHHARMNAIPVLYIFHDSENYECECTSYAKYKERYTNAREEYGKPIDSEFTAFTADMQKVILIPKLTTKDHVFINRLVVFNETFACLNSNNVGGNILILWHKGIPGRNADDVTSAYVKLIWAVDCLKLLIWVDNCGARTRIGVCFLDLFKLSTRIGVP